MIRSIIIFACLSVISCVAQDSKLSKFILLPNEEINFEQNVSCTFIIEQLGDNISVPGNIKKIGGFSRQFPKNSYALTLDQPYSISGLEEDTDWILNASYIDKTFMRHRLSFDLFRKMDKSNIAPQTSYVKLYQGAMYMGIYVLMQRVDQSIIAEAPDSNSFLCMECPVFRKDLMHHDSLNYPVTILSSSGNTQKQKRDIIDFYNFLVNSDESHFAGQIVERIDLPNFIDWHILLLLTNNSDGILKNFALYKERLGALFNIAIWDYDHSFGRDGDNELNMLDRNVDISRSILFDRLIEDKQINYNFLLNKRYRELKEAGILTKEFLYQLMDKYDAEIRGEIEENAILWPTDAIWYEDANGYSEEISLMKKFISLNFSRLDSLLQGSDL